MMNPKKIYSEKGNYGSLTMVQEYSRFKFTRENQTTILSGLAKSCLSRNCAATRKEWNKC